MPMPLHTYREPATHARCTYAAALRVLSVRGDRAPIESQCGKYRGCSSGTCARARDRISFAAVCEHIHTHTNKRYSRVLNGIFDRSPRAYMYFRFVGQQSAHRIYVNNCCPLCARDGISLRGSYTLHTRSRVCVCIYLTRRATIHSAFANFTTRKPICSDVAPPRHLA